MLPLKISFPYKTVCLTVMLVCLGLVLSQNSKTSVVSSQAVTTNCNSLEVPLIVHGFATNYDLPDGDHFFLNSDIKFSIVTPLADVNGLPGTKVFEVNQQTFGADEVSIGAYEGTSLKGLRYETPNGRLTALSCSESIWDGSFLLATQGATVGDVIRLFVQNPDGSDGLTLAQFAVEDGGWRVTHLSEHVGLYRNNRYGGSGTVAQGDFLPFIAAAGEAGSRSDLLTIAFSMAEGSPLNNCRQLGISVLRSNGVGSSGFVFTDVMVNRMEVSGDRERSGRGLYAGLEGGYPSGLKCNVTCSQCQPAPTPTPTPTPVPTPTPTPVPTPTPTPVPTPTPTPVPTPTPTPVPTPTPETYGCVTFCFRSSDYWVLNLRKLPAGKIFISGSNINQAISTHDTEKLLLALNGNTNRFYGSLSPQEYFNQQWVAAQLNHFWASCGGSPNFYNTQWSSLVCYGLSFTPLTLSNGYTLTPQTMLKDLFNQAYLAAIENRHTDFGKLANLFKLLNGDGVSALCN